MSNQNALTLEKKCSCVELPAKRAAFSLWLRTLPSFKQKLTTNLKASFQANKQAESFRRFINDRKRK